MNTLLQSRWLPILMLVVSNIFMTIAWYGGGCSWGEKVISNQ